MDIIQKAYGIGNKQNIFLEVDKFSIDIIPDDIEVLLDYINEHSYDALDKMQIFVSDLNKKNILNGIDLNQFQSILEDIPLFDDIEMSIKEDRSGLLKRKYFKASKLLNLQYMEKFQGNIPQFIVKVTKTFNDDTQFNNQNIIKLLVLLHYMYHECDLGIRPW